MVMMVALPVAAEKWEQEPTGFGGLPFGATRAQVIEHFKATCVPTKMVTHKQDPKYGGQVKRKNADDLSDLSPYAITDVCTRPGYFVTDLLSGTAEFTLMKGDGPDREFHAVELRVYNKVFPTVKALLWNKYGEPTVTDTTKGGVTGAEIGAALVGGAAAVTKAAIEKQRFQVFVWAGEKVIMTVTQPPMERTGDFATVRMERLLTKRVKDAL